MSQSVTHFLEQTVAGESALELKETHRVSLRLALALAASAAWGAAAASSDLPLALCNLFKLPVIVLLSMLTALPLAIVLLRQLELGFSTRQLVLAHASATATAAIVLGAFAPLLGLYVRTSAHGALGLALISAAIALFSGGAVFLRKIRHLAAPGELGRSLAVASVILVAHGAAALQLVALATPILPVHTIFGAGIDGFLK